MLRTARRSSPFFDFSPEPPRPTLDLVLTYFGPSFDPKAIGQKYMFSCIFDRFHPDAQDLLRRYFWPTLIFRSFGRFSTFTQGSESKQKGRGVGLGSKSGGDDETKQA